jgi:broad specificity phosphatase PhoE
MAKILIIRHSIAQANAEGIMMGSRVDSPLADTGIAIAKARGAAFREQGFKPDKVYCSTLSRAKQTAEIILQELDRNVPITQLAALNERDFGQYSGKPYRFALDAFEEYGADPPTVEPVDAFVKRVTDVFEHIKNEAVGTTLVVTHSNTEMVMRALVFRPAMVQKFWELGDPPYCEGFELTV